MVVRLNDWVGLAQGRRDDFNALHIAAIEAQANSSWGGPFRVTANDKKSYFVKSLQTCPPGQGASLAAELIVACLGRRISAPVCETTLIRIPEVLAGEQVGQGRPPLQAGLAHASRALNRAEEHRPALAARAEDDNCRRHVGVYALYDWCFGSDQQWLYDLDDERAIFSHDHGLYFPPFNIGGWTRDELVRHVGEAHELPDPRDGLSREEAKRVAIALERFTRDELAEVLQSVPCSWPVSDDDLEALGWFLECRIAGVAERVRRLA